MTILERVAYLKGLSEGMELETEKSKEGKLISVIIEVLEDIGMSIADLEENSLALGDEIDELSDDLSEVEEIVYDEDYDDEDDDDVYIDDDDFYEVECPSCSASLSIDEDAVEAGSFTCPECGQELSISDADDDDDEDCDCDEHKE